MACTDKVGVSRAYVEHVGYVMRKRKDISRAMVKISFILPMYKAEKYLPRVIESLKSQTMPDFEAIFVDDGSPDNSARVCRELFGEDTRFVLIRKENGGVSSARNVGLDAARGKYIFFVDPDDSIEPNSAELLWESAEREQADIVFFSRRNDRYKNGELISSSVASLGIEGVFRPRPCVDHFDKIATAYFVTDKLFKRELIERAHIRFRDMDIGEDGVFFAEYIRLDVTCAVFLPDALYRYRIDEGQTLSTSYHKKRERDNFRLSNTIRETVALWGKLEDKAYADTVRYCTVRDLQLGIKNINLSTKSLRERCAWLHSVMRDTWVRESVRRTKLSRANSRNDKIKLLLLKLHLYDITIFISGLDRRHK